MKTKSKKILLNLIIPVLITAVILYFFLKDVSFSDMKKALSNIPPGYIIFYFILSLLGTFLRAIRYRILLARQIGFRDMFLITLVRNFAVDLLPARTAAFIFYSYLTKKKGLPLEQGSSSFVVAVFYDGLALSVMLGGLLFFFTNGINRLAIYTGMLLIFLVSILVIFFSDKIILLILKLKLFDKFSKIKTFG